MHIAVVGAGIAGITTAYYLAKAGAEVTVFDRQPHAAGEGSYANGGQIAICNSETWHTCSVLTRALKWLLKKEAPLYLHPLNWDAAKIKWMFAFLEQIASKRYVHNTRQAIALGLKSRALYLQLFEEETLPCELRQAGMVHIYRNQALLDGAKEVCHQLADSGWGRHAVSPEDIARIDPNLRLDGVVGGTYIESDYCADAKLFCRQLQVRLAQHYGVEFQLGKSVDRMEQHAQSVSITSGNKTARFDKVVISAGAYTDKLLRIMGLPSVNIYPVKGYSLSLNVSGQHVGRSS